MACLYIQSDNEHFSYVINKNPNSGMKGVKLNKGRLFGYFSNSQQYNIVFLEDIDEVAFPKYANQEFSYINSSRYNSPRFISTAIMNYLDSALNKQNAYDVPANYVLYINSVQIYGNSLSRIINQFPEFNININPLINDNYSLTIRCHTTLYALLNFMYILAFLITIWDDIYINIDSSLIQRLIRAIQIIDAPYYIRYLIKIYAIHDNFKQYKENLEQSNRYNILLSPQNNQNIRLTTIASLLSQQNDVIDFGAGEGKLVKYIKNFSHTYYAIENNTTLMPILERNLTKANMQYIISDTIKYPINKAYEVVMSEVFEHNSLEYMTTLLWQLINDINCKRIILTTPNKEFNQFYALSNDELRHKDHKFEMTYGQLNNYFNQFNCSYRIINLGDEVNNIPTTYLIFLEKC